MRTPSAALLTEQKKPTRRPAVRVRILDTFAGSSRIRTTNWYSGTEPAGAHGAACDAAGSLLRLRIEANTLYRQLVTTPTSGDNYSVWTSLRTTTSLCAVTWCGTFFMAVAVDSGTPTQVYYSTSTDGVAWAGWILAFTHTVTVTSIGLGGRSNGNAVIAVNNGNDITARRWNGSAWGAAVTTTDGLVTPTGVAVVYRGDYRVLFTGAIVSGGGSRLGSRFFGNGQPVTLDTWGSATAVIDAPASALTAYSAPFAASARCTVRETYTGTGAYDRTAHYREAESFGHIFTEPIPFNLDHDFGLAICQNTTPVFLTTPSRVYAAPLDVATIDATADVLSVDMIQGDALADDKTTIVISNARGTYNGPPDPITRGATVAIDPGYNIAGTPEYNAGPYVWVERIVSKYRDRSGVLVLECRPMGWWLARWKAPRTITYASKSPATIIRDILARVGFDAASGGGFPAASALSASLSLTVIIPAGTSAKDALRLVLSRIPDQLATNFYTAYLMEPLASEASDADYSYHGTAHPITGADYISALKPAPHVRVLGGPGQPPVIGEAIDYVEAELAYAPAKAIADRDATTAVLADGRAASVMRGYEAHANDDVIIAAVHTGLDVGDVIAITDSRVSLVAAKRRVRRLSLHFERRTAARAGRPANRGRYEHEIVLGSP